MSASHQAIHDRFGLHIGSRFNQLTFLGLAKKRGDNNRFYGHFQCECGNIISRQASRVINTGNPKHCGCLTDKGAHRKHGMRNTSEYSIWNGMKNRCLNEKDKNYPSYGGRGISIYKPWIDSFEEFFSFMGPRPSGLTLDRIDTNGNYEPTNVRWASVRQQNRNTRASYKWHIKGETFDSVYDAAAFFGVTATTITRWVRGCFDKRDGRFYGNRDDCYAIKKY